MNGAELLRSQGLVRLPGAVCGVSLEGGVLVTVGCTHGYELERRCFLTTLVAVGVLVVSP